MLGLRAADAGRELADDDERSPLAFATVPDVAVDRDADTERASLPSPALPAAPSKWVAGAMSLILLVLVASPIFENWKDDPDDDFPLSYYPMFTFDKSDRQRLSYLIGVDAKGERRYLEFQLGGPGGMNQVRRQLSKMISQKQASQFCRSVAKRIADSNKSHKDVVAVEIVSGTFQMSTFFQGKVAPTTEDVRARCPVLRD